MSILPAARHSLAVAVLGLPLVCAAPASATMYRWVDDTGAVVYSQSPPPDGRAASAVAPPPPPSSSADAERQQLEGQLKQADEARKKQQEGQKAQQETAAKDADRKRNCDAARQNLELIQNRPPQTRFQMPNGEYRRFTDEEREAELKKAREFVDKNCR
jgi:type IV secretory pathway VirB10-like protein